MTDPVQIIPFTNLSLAFIPVFVVAGILYKWTSDGNSTIYAVFRMLVQLLLIGYFLIFIFASDSAWIVISILLIMLCTSSWIALRTVQSRRRELFRKAFYAITLGGGITLLLITQGVLGLNPWYWPQYMIPLAGMIFANAMNSVSLAAERLTSEMDRGVPYQQARNIAFRASLIPITNSLLAVGLVSLPGMMTGQILSGVSPLIAVRYQIMVMCMVFAASGISAACFLKFLEPDK